MSSQSYDFILINCINKLNTFGHVSSELGFPIKKHMQLNIHWSWHTYSGLKNTNRVNIIENIEKKNIHRLIESFNQSWPIFNI